MRAWEDEQSRKIEDGRVSRRPGLDTQPGATPFAWDDRTVNGVHNQIMDAGAGALTELKAEDEQLVRNWVGLAERGADLATGGKKTILAWGDELTQAGREIIKEKLGDFVRDRFGSPDISVLERNLRNDVDFRRQWEQAAREAWKMRLHHGKGAWPGVNYHDEVWTGDPELYEKKYGVKITKPGGELLPLHEINKDPEKLLAYNAWLKDPAIVDHLDRRKFHGE